MNILLVDHYPSLGRMVESLLKEERPEYQILAQSFTEESARQQASDLHPGIILLEPLLFGHAPQTMAFRLNSFHELSPESRLIALTSSTNREHVRVALRSGFSDYLYKPLQPAELLAALDHCSGSGRRLPDHPEITEEKNLVMQIHHGNVEGALDSFRKIASRRENETYAQWCVQYMELATRVLHAPDEVTQIPDNLSLIYQDFIRYSSQHNSFDDLDSAMEEFVTQSTRSFNSHSGDPGYRIVRQAMQIVSEHLDEDLTLNRVAGALYISTTYFSRLFKSKTGKNFSEYLAEQRVERAKLLLTTTDLQIKTIAAQVGYPEANSFARLFKSHTGKTLTQYRKENKGG